LPTRQRFCFVRRHPARRNIFNSLQIIRHNKHLGWQKREAATVRSSDRFGHDQDTEIEIPAGDAGDAGTFVKIPHRPYDMQAAAFSYWTGLVERVQQKPAYLGKYHKTRKPANHFPRSLYRYGFNSLQTPANQSKCLQISRNAHSCSRTYQSNITAQSGARYQKRGVQVSCGQAREA
jgi:hypothetical protein